MSIALSLLGLSVSTLGAAILLSAEIRERSKQEKRTKELANLKNEIKTWEITLKDCVRLITSANRGLHPTIDKYPLDEGTVPIQQNIKELQNKIDSIEDINTKVLDDLLQLSHPVAFGLLMIGFLLQAAGLLL